MEIVDKKLKALATKLLIRKSKKPIKEQKMAYLNQKPTQNSQLVPINQK